jgi:hypothetical protein
MFFSIIDRKDRKHDDDEILFVRYESEGSREGHLIQDEYPIATKNIPRHVMERIRMLDAAAGEDGRATIPDFGGRMSCSQWVVYYIPRVFAEGAAGKE